MTKNDKNTYVKIEVTGFQQICNELANLKEENKKLIFENNKLKEELLDIKSLGMFEFADKYCNDKQLADAGQSFARSLGIGLSDFEKAEIAAEEYEDELCSAMGSYLGDDY